VEEICRHALATGKKQTRNTQRLTPIMRIGKANFDDLLEIGKEVLEPHFHKGQEGVKVMINLTIVVVVHRKGECVCVLTISKTKISLQFDQHYGTTTS